MELEEMDRQAAANVLFALQRWQSRSSDGPLFVVLEDGSSKPVSSFAALIVSYLCGTMAVAKP